MYRHVVGYRSTRKQGRKRRRRQAMPDARRARPLHRGPPCPRSSGRVRPRGDGQLLPAFLAWRQLQTRFHVRPNASVASILIREALAYQLGR